MRFDFGRLDATARFALMTATVVPRPIALVTTLDTQGRLNAAPYSFFGLLAVTPPLLGIGVLPHAEGRMKDTGANVLATGELVANLVSEEMAEAMNLTCLDAPPGVDEAALAGLATTMSDRIAPPRLATSPVAFECVLHQAITLGPGEAVLLACIVTAHIADALAGADPPGSIDTPGLRLFGAMHAARWYARTTDRFAMERPNWQDWSAARGGRG